MAPIELVPHRTSAQILLRRMRGVLFLATLVAVPATVTLSAMHVLKWLSVGIALGALVVVLVWLRLSAISEQKARRARRTELRRLEELRAAGRSVSGAFSTTAGSTAWVPGTDAPAAKAKASARAAGSTRHTGGVSAAAAATSVRRAAGEVEVDPGAWQPVPVPPPTYTLKDPAPRPEPASVPAPVAVHEGQRPVPIDVDDDDLEIMAAAHGRRLVGG